jgi:Helix-turn-helix domain
MAKDNQLPTSEEIEATVLRALRHYGYSPGKPLTLRENAPAAAGVKLRRLREQSGWTVCEIAERTGVRLDVLTAFEDGDSAAAGEMSRVDLQRLASACCGSLADVLGNEHPWTRTEPDSSFIGSSGCSIDPWG